MKVKDIIAELNKLNPASDILCITYESSILSEISAVPLDAMPDFITMLETNLDLEGLQLDIQTLASIYLAEK